MWPPRASWENPCRRSPARGGHLKLIQPETDLYVDLYCDRPAILLGRFKAPLPDCFYRLLVETETGDKDGDRKSTRLNSSHTVISYAVFCLKKKKHQLQQVGTE